MTLFYNYFVDNVLGYKIDCRLDEVWVLLKLENERKLPESKPLLWLDIKERDWGPGKVLQKLRDAGVSVDMGGTGLFLCPHNELSKAKRQMPANWKALHQDAMHGLEAEVVVVAGDLVLQKELWNRAQKQVVVVTSNELSEVAKRKWREHGFTKGMYLMADGMSNESPEWESMTHFLEQLVAHDPSHHKREVLDPRFSEPGMVFPMDVEAKELQSCSTFSITEIQFREKLNFGQEKKKLDAERSLPPPRRRPSSGGRCGFGWLWNGGPCLCGQNCTLESFEKP